MIDKQTEISARAVKRAMRAARVIKFSGVSSMPILIVIAVASFSVSAAFGCAAIVSYLLFLMILGAVLSKRARCPRCNTFWHCRVGARSFTMRAATAVVRPDVDLNVDETKDFKCRNCGLELRPYLRKEEPHSANTLSDR